MSRTIIITVNTGGDTFYSRIKGTDATLSEVARELVNKINHDEVIRLEAPEGILLLGPERSKIAEFYIREEE